jgi:hypothetical protein
VSIQMIITGRRRQVTAIALGLSRAQKSLGRPYF